MKRIAKIVLLLICTTLYFCGCGYAGPEKAVKNELDLIQQLDESTIRSFVSYEDIQFSSSPTIDIDEETTEAVKLFFKNFRYKIVSSTQTKDNLNATVKVDITNLDSQLLAKDLCKEMYKESLEYSNSNSTGSLNSSFSLMRNFLQSNHYPLKTTSADISLIKQNGVWCIQEDPQLEDALVGGLVSYLNDPYLLSPEEVLSLTLDPFKTFTADDWKNYLGISDVFAVGNDQASTLDQLLCQQIARYFDFDITDSVQDSGTAQVTVEITSMDMYSIIESCIPALIDYAGTTESIRASDVEVTKKTGDILISALEHNSTVTVTPVIVSMTNDGLTWDAQLDENFTEALLGNLDSALTLLNNACK